MVLTIIMSHSCLLWIIRIAITSTVNNNSHVKSTQKPKTFGHTSGVFRPSLLVLTPYGRDLLLSRLSLWTLGTSSHGWPWWATISITVSHSWASFVGGWPRIASFVAGECWVTVIDPSAEKAFPTSSWTPPSPPVRRRQRCQLRCSPPARHKKIFRKWGAEDHQISWLMADTRG